MRTVKKMNFIYQPSAEILQSYANVLVNYALNSGQGVKAGEVVQINVPDVAKPLGLALQNATLTAGAHPLVRLLPTGFDKDFFSLARHDQLAFFPKKYFRARVEVMDHQIAIIADPDPEELKGVDPSKIFLARDSKKLFRDWLNAKETRGKFTWTAALWGVQAKADLVGLSLKAYWQQIIKACFLDQADPLAQWRAIQTMQTDILGKLNAVVIEDLEIKGPDVDLTVKLGKYRKWMGGSGRNIPSFEFFTSPDWRGTQGWVKFNQPLYRYGNVVKGIELEFDHGLIVKARAAAGQSVLSQMLKTTNADKIGEYSLTDKRMSRITHVMAETLYDENMGGRFGNTHLAIGMSYQDTYRGDASKVNKATWKRLGFNDSAEHTDIISTTDRIVTAHLANGVRKVIYAAGQFVL